MKNILKLALVCSSFSVFSRPLVIGIRSAEESMDTEPLRVYLEKKLSQEVQIYKAKDYDDLLNHFKKEDLDFAFFSALDFIHAEKEIPAKVLLKVVRGENEFYYSSVIVLASSKIFKLSDLKGKKIGFVDRESMGGYWVPLSLFKQEQILLQSQDEKPASQAVQYSFWGTHEKSVQALFDKKVDAVAVWNNGGPHKDAAWNTGSFSKANDKKLRIIKTSTPVPSDAFVVREKFFKEKALLAYSVMEALIGAGDEAPDSVKKLFKASRMATATSRHYDNIRILEKSLQ